MPVLDWSRTALNHPMADDSQSLFYETTLAELKKARDHFAIMNESEIATLTKSIIAGLPRGTTEEVLTLEKFQMILDTYVNAVPLRKNLVQFLKQIIPIP